MKALKILERLEYMIETSTPSRFSDTVKLDFNDLSNTVNELRAAVENDLHRAKEIIKERETLISDAEREAEVLIKEVEGKIRTMVDDSQIVKEAENQAAIIINDAQEKADKMKKGADKYAEDVLGKLEIYLSKSLETVSEGKKQLSASSQHYEENRF